MLRKFDTAINQAVFLYDSVRLNQQHLGFFTLHFVHQAVDFCKPDFSDSTRFHTCKEKSAQ
ncbi:hypothetical protein C4Q31_15770 [Leptospira borgpetersenii serovar Ceylonica]|nr:hypothetical protein C4Q31_15415 [Leptospira borgpetersenii serovar Ceylonica]AXX17342.1 hypothetical protein C4Q31_15770 [Leptospira borgpetersenii serovar Ceylonica]